MTLSFGLECALSLHVRDRVEGGDRLKGLAGGKLASSARHLLLSPRGAAPKLMSLADKRKGEGDRNKKK